MRARSVSLTFGEEFCSPKLNYMSGTPTCVPISSVSCCPQPYTTYHAHFDTLRELQVELAVSDPRIFLIQFKKLALLEEQDGIEVVLLDLPELEPQR